MRLTKTNGLYVETSIAHRQALRERDEARKAHELELQRQAANRLRYLAVVLTVFLIVAVGLSLLAWNREQQAQDNADEALSLVLASGAREALREHQPDVALALAMQANQIDDSPIESRRVLADAASQSWIKNRYIGHSQRVYGVAYSPDGQSALSTSGDRMLILWDVASGEVLHQFNGHDDLVYGVDFSPDGQTAISSSEDQSLILWDITTGDIIRRFEGGHTKRIFAVAFSPDGQMVVSGSDDGALALWEVESGDLLLRFEGHQGPVFAVDFSPDGADDSFRLMGSERDPVECGKRRSGSCDAGASGTRVGCSHQPGWCIDYLRL